MKRKVRSTLKKVMAALLAAMMLLMVTACSDAGSGTQTTGEKKKIGMLWYGNTDAMGGTFYAWANHAAEVLDVELVWALGGLDTATQLADCENLINSGCDGIYFIPMDTAANLQLGNACQQAGVYWSTSNRDIIDDEVLAAVEANPYFVTRIYDNSYDVCKDMVKQLADQGITKVCMISGDPTDAMMVDRNNGFIDGCAENNIEILGTFQNPTSGDATTVVDGVNNFMTLYPDMQAILAVSGTNGTGEAIMSALNGSGKEPGSIKVAAFDTFDGNQEAFDQGWLSVSCGGYTTECLVSFLALVNRVQGNVISDHVFEMTLSPLLITSSEDMQIFSEYVDNPDVQLYSDELIQSLVGPDVTQEDYQAVLDDWSIDFVKEAVGLT
ncbi:MAG TPA: substrate-binding domain-containing protein [Candidatus Egerieicola pullicola]|uniref:Substrate-binding domain-containing protein n=1 Tax=Candidatus Egerieicola pullicola TaxID=2840775 RepID=A0A9D1AK81_9FIRM|nr:substrate-binding domain-containing protein [Candidatus Egerieicola pullicola]